MRVRLRPAGPGGPGAAQDALRGERARPDPGTQEASGPSSPRAAKARGGGGAHRRSSAPWRQSSPRDPPAGLRWWRCSCPKLARLRRSRGPEHCAHQCGGGGGAAAAAELRLRPWWRLTRARVHRKCRAPDHTRWAARSASRSARAL